MRTGFVARQHNSPQGQIALRTTTLGKKPASVRRLIRPAMFFKIPPGASHSHAAQLSSGVLPARGVWTGPANRVPSWTQTASNAPFRKSFVLSLINGVNRPAPAGSVTIVFPGGERHLRHLALPPGGKILTRSLRQIDGRERPRLVQGATKHDARPVLYPGGPAEKEFVSAAPHAIGRPAPHGQRNGQKNQRARRRHIPAASLSVVI